MTDADTKVVVAFGEVLWDCLPRGLFLGGAPLNVAYHAARLGAEAYVASSVGNDFLGDESVRRVEAAGVRTDLLKRHSSYPTGASVASLDKSGDATYEIIEKVAWDGISLEEKDRDVVAAADAIVYGSLAARSPSNFDLMQRLLKQSDALKICDVNLRTPYDDRERALKLLKLADVIKVNDDELKLLVDRTEGELLELIGFLHQLTGVRLICVTLGKNGAVLWRNGKFLSLPAEEVTVADTIGAGDSFTAALCMGVLEKRRLEVILQRALRLSALVASKSGAQPAYKVNSLFD